MSPEKGPDEPDEFGQVLRFARGAHGLSQKQLAEATGVNPAQISLYEQGHRTPRRRTRERLAAGAGLSLPQFERLLPVMRSASTGKVPSGSPEEAAALAAQVARAVSDAVLVALGDQPFGHLAPEVSARQAAPARWARLWAQEPATRRLLIEEMEEYRGWELSEHGCDESEKVAADDAALALEMAELALFVAERGLGGELWRACLRGHCYAFVANARRVGGDHRGAEQAFAQGRALSQAGAAADPGLLDASRALDLEASLRRDQRRFPEALELLDQALAASATPAGACRILLKRASTHEQMGDCESALDVLERAAPLLDAESEPRLVWVHRFNRAVSICNLQRYVEAAPVAAEARELAVALGNEIDLLRVLWLDARVAAGLGRGQEAIGALREVKKGFADREMAYDATLATLDLAVLLREENETAEVRALAEEMVAVFESLEIHREALAAVRVFWQAVQQEKATAELCRRLVRFLERARHDSELRFDSGFKA